MSAIHALYEGERFGAYRVLSRLASGGMADVWFVEAASGGSRGVLKTMRPELSTKSELRTMFLDEGRVAADLQHENIARVLEVGVLEGQPYIAMEFVHGRTLRQIAQHCLAEQRRIDTWFVLRTLIDVCGALEYLHSYADAEGWHLGLAHGDISPENIMVGFNGTVKLLDFGVSRAARHAERTGPRLAPDDSMVAPANDQRSLIIGKPWYMAPEQIEGANISHLSDLYSLGVVLYECLTGYRPYAGATQAEVLARVLEAKPPPPQEIARGISEPLAWTTLRTMARDPNHRFSSAGDLAAALRARLREVDPSGGIVGGRTLDGYMAGLFGEPDTLASAVMRTISERTRHSDFPTAPCAPADVAAALAQAAPSAPPPARVRDRQSVVERSGSFPAQTSVPDIFGQSSKRELPPSSPPPFGRVFGPEESASAWTSAMGTRHRTDGEQEAAHLFEQGLALLAAKDFEGARDAWERAAELDPRERRYRINLRKLQERP